MISLLHYSRIAIMWRRRATHNFSPCTCAARCLEHVGTEFWREPNKMKKRNIESHNHNMLCLFIARFSCSWNVIEWLFFLMVFEGKHIVYTIRRCTCSIYSLLWLGCFVLINFVLYTWTFMLQTDKRTAIRSIIRN